MRLAQRARGRRGGGARPCSPAPARSRSLAELPASPHPGVALAGPGRARERDLRAARLGRARARGRPARRPAPLAALFGAAGVAALVGWQQLERRSRPRRPRLDGVSRPSTRLATTVAASAADFEGSRFTGTAAAADEIGPGAQDPIRVFVGVDAAATRRGARAARRRRARAARRVRRAAGILVCSPTLRGYVNPIPVAAEEHLAGGDVASVASSTTTGARCCMPAEGADRGAHAPRAARGAAAAGAGRRPEICVYGESLGAWASAERVPPRRRARARRGAAWRARCGSARRTSRACRGCSRRARSRPTRASARSARRELLAGEVRAATARFVFLERRTDPVVLFSGLDLIWRRPDWLPPGRWTPGVTFVQLAFDLVSATNWTATVPQALAHDYRLEGPLAVDLAFGHHAGRERARRAGRPARRRGGRARRADCVR